MLQRLCDMKYRVLMLRAHVWICTRGISLISLCFLVFDVGFIAGTARHQPDDDMARRRRIPYMRHISHLPNRLFLFCREEIRVWPSAALFRFCWLVAWLAWLGWLLAALGADPADIGNVDEGPCCP